MKAGAETISGVGGKTGREAVALYFPRSRNARRFALVSKVLSAMEIHHCAVIPWLKRRGLGRLVEEAIQSPFCRMVIRQPKSTEIIIAETGQISRKGRMAQGKKILSLSFDTKGFLSNGGDENTFFHPILFHPDMINEASYGQARALSTQSERSIGVLFAGNCDATIYMRTEMRTRYGLLNRVEIAALAWKRTGQQVFVPDDRARFEEALSKGELRDRLVWIDTNFFRIPQNEWLSLIAKSRFFVCTPGVQYPYCQNLNEAAACGSVPILQFPTAYFPALENGRNCLSFETAVDFPAVISSALAMGEQQRLPLSKGAVAYHEAHLSLDAIRARLSKFFLDEEKADMTWVMAGK